ncbi:SUMF1/EgtB/PvdO family nonheme iron enzyme [Capnocytophaga cynodegmi]|uniref:SUMF1/EgtB/PvdO family nonheme iron enzyme n=1 Tax=Capnocytophaga cynodegmi TaxID=28189 RepID=UPI00385CC0FD
MRKIITYFVAFFVLATSTNCVKGIEYDDLRLSTEKGSLRVGEKIAFKITSGSGEYDVISAQENIVKVSKSETEVTLTGINKGETTVSVEDKVTGQKMSVKVTVYKALEDLSLDKSEINVAPKESGIFNVKTGNGTYELIVANTNIAKASISGSKITISAVAIGSTTLIIKDKESNKTAQVKISVVEKLALSKSELLIKSNGEEVLSVMGSGHYTTKSGDEAIAKATFSANKLTIKSGKAGTTIINVTDVKTGRATDVKVIVIADISLSKREVTIERGKNNQDVVISSGSGEYTISSANSNVATASISGGKLVIRGASQGTTQILVKDSKTGKVAEVRVVVTVANITLSSLSATLRATETTSINILTGSGSYEATSSSIAVAAVSISGNKVAITGKAIGSTKVTVKDKITGKVAVINVSVSAKNNIKLAQTTTEIKVGVTRNVVISSGSGNYVAVSGNTGVVTANISGNVLIVKGIKSGNTNITISNGVDNPAVLSVKVVAPAPVVPPTSNERDLGELAFVEGGTFQMGTPSRGDGDEILHTVTLSSFKISKHEITNAQYAKFLTAKGNQRENGAIWYQGKDIVKEGNSFKARVGRENYPVVFVTWHGAKAYAEWVGGSLPTEAQWEYAARGGNKSKGYTYSGSNNIGEVAWYLNNSGGRLHEVGTKKPNELGIYDMSGNVWEWTADLHGRYVTTPQTDPTGSTTGTNRVRRGASAFCTPNTNRATNRSNRAPNGIRHNLGFRVVFK